MRSCCTRVTVIAIERRQCSERPVSRKDSGLRARSVRSSRVEDSRQLSGLTEVGFDGSGVVYVVWGRK